MSPSENSTIHIDGFGPLPVDRPASASDLGDLVRAASDAGHALYPVGGSTQLGLGMPPTRDGRAIDTRGLDSVIDYPARDMTVTVGAGITVAKLRDTLAAENQRLPIDVPNPAQTTLGGVIAANNSGTRRYGFGTLRDYVIGISAVNDLGEEIKAGGRVVKNVAGYDLCKLFIGSLGTLGVVTQVTLKVQPRPEAQTLIFVPCSDDMFGKVLDLIHGSATRPVCVDLLSPEAGPRLNDRFPERPFTAAWTVAVGFEENRQAVEWQTDEFLGKELTHGRGDHSHVVRGEDCEPYWDALREMPAIDAGFTFKATLPPSGLAEFCSALRQFEPRPALHAHAGNGIVHGHLFGGPTVSEARDLLKRARTLLGLGPGGLTVTRCPPEWKAELPVWGEPRPDWGVMRAVKRKLDPKAIFNPGRFVGGI